MRRIVDGYRLFSNSELGDWKRCPRKWWLAWFRGLAPKRETLYGVRNIGTRGHAALAEYYAHGTNPLEAHREVMAADLAKAGELGYDEHEILALHKDFAMEIAMLSGYMQWLEESGEDRYLQAEGSEAYLEIPFQYNPAGNAPVKLIGKLDVPMRNLVTGKLLFMDHKFVGSLNVKGLRQNTQMLHYHLLQWMGSEGHTRCEGGLYNMLKRSKRTARAVPPFYKREEVPHNFDELLSYLGHLRVIVGQVMDADEKASGSTYDFAPSWAYPNRRDDCEWSCAFKDICPMFDDGSRVEDAIADRYTEIDPLTYYQGKEQRTDV